MFSQIEALNETLFPSSGILLRTPPPLCPSYLGHAVNAHLVGTGVHDGVPVSVVSFHEKGFQKTLGFAIGAHATLPDNTKGPAVRVRILHIAYQPRLFAYVSLHPDVLNVPAAASRAEQVRSASKLYVRAFVRARVLLTLPTHTVVDVPAAKGAIVALLRPPGVCAKMAAIRNGTAAPTARNNLFVSESVAIVVAAPLPQGTDDAFTRRLATSPCIAGTAADPQPMLSTVPVGVLAGDTGAFAGAVQRAAAPQRVTEEEDAEDALLVKLERLVLSGASGSDVIRAVGGAGDVLEKVAHDIEEDAAVLGTDAVGSDFGADSDAAAEEEASTIGGSEGDEALDEEDLGVDASDDELIGGTFAPPTGGAARKAGGVKVVDPYGGVDVAAAVQRFKDGDDKTKAKAAAAAASAATTATVEKKGKRARAEEGASAAPDAKRVEVPTPATDATVSTLMAPALSAGFGGAFDFGVSAGVLDGMVDVTETLGAEDALFSSSVTAGGPAVAPVAVGGAVAGDSRRAVRAERRAAGEAAAAAASARDEYAAPETDTDFRRLTLASPQSSVLWVRWMAAKVDAGDMASARDVAEAALATVDSREGPEVLNVWKAFVRLECLFGTEQSARLTFKRALRATNAPDDIYGAYVDASCDAGRPTVAATALRSFAVHGGHSRVEVWVRWYAHILKYTPANGVVDALRELNNELKRTLATKHHREASVRLAVAEYKSDGGSVDRGRSMLERVVSNNSSRLDVWAVYADMETHVLRGLIAAAAAGAAAHHGEVRAQKERVRALFDRGASAARKPRQIQAWFLRWFDWETAHGTEASAAAVRDRVAALLASNTAAAATAIGPVAL